MVFEARNRSSKLLLISFFGLIRICGKISKYKAQGIKSCGEGEGEGDLPQLGKKEMSELQSIYRWIRYDSALQHFDGEVPWSTRVRSSNFAALNNVRITEALNLDGDRKKPTPQLELMKKEHPNHSIFESVLQCS